MAATIGIALLATAGCSESLDTIDEVPEQPVVDQFTPYTNVGPGMGELSEIYNRYPGVAIFDFDRDGDLDYYVTQAEINAPLEVAMGGANRLFRNDGRDVFAEVAGGGHTPH